MHRLYLYRLRLLHRGSEGAGAKARFKIKTKLLVKQQLAKSDEGEVHPASQDAMDLDLDLDKDPHPANQAAEDLGKDAATLPHDIKSYHQVESDGHSTITKVPIHTSRR